DRRGGVSAGPWSASVGHDFGGRLVAEAFDENDGVHRSAGQALAQLRQRVDDGRMRIGHMCEPGTAAADAALRRPSVELTGRTTHPPEPCRGLPRWYSNTRPPTVTSTNAAPRKNTQASKKAKPMPATAAEAAMPTGQ